MEANIEHLKSEIEARLAQVVGVCGSGADGRLANAGRLTEAMAYSLLAPAKRVRAVLAMLSAEHLGADPAAALDPAVAVEMVHAASLVLDDLPAMDDALMRRGRATSHRVFGEDTAILAAIALMNGAFGVTAAASGLTPQARCEATAILAASIGPEGLTGGQELDLRSGKGGAADLATIERTHELKTAVLFAAGTELGALAAGANQRDRSALRRFGLHLGLAFQAFDDLLDGHATSAAIGKDVDRDHGKATAVLLLGRDGAEQRARAHVTAALSELGEIGGKETRLKRYAAELVARLTAPLSASTSTSSR